jgi:hypothetical protein
MSDRLFLPPSIGELTPTIENDLLDFSPEQKALPADANHFYQIFLLPAQDGSPFERVVLDIKRFFAHDRAPDCS